MAMKPLSSSQPAHESLDTTPADDVLNLLEQVESQFERIRALRRTQDDTVRSLTSRADELDARELPVAVAVDRLKKLPPALFLGRAVVLTLLPYRL